MTRFNTSPGTSPATITATPAPVAGSTAATEVFQAGLVAHMPQLRAMARALTGSRDRADDLVQDTLARALAAEARFTPGTNQKAWLMTILRNQWISDLRAAKNRRTEELTADTASMPAAQLPNVELIEVGMAIQRMPATHQEVLTLVAAGGVDQEEAARLCGCAVGTIKSRLNRARTLLRVLLTEPGAGLGPASEGGARTAFGVPRRAQRRSSPGAEPHTAAREPASALTGRGADIRRQGGPAVTMAPMRPARRAASA